MNALKIKKYQMNLENLIYISWASFFCSGGCQSNNYNFNGDIKIYYEISYKMQKKRIQHAIL